MSKDPTSKASQTDWERVQMQEDEDIDMSDIGSDPSRCGQLTREERGKESKRNSSRVDDRWVSAPSSATLATRGGPWPREEYVTRDKTKG
jgi:hypothetical protein